MALNASYHTNAGLGMGRVILAPTRPADDGDAAERLRDLRMIDMADREGAKSTCPKAFVGAVAHLWSGQLITGHNGAPEGVETCETAGCVVIPATATAREYSRHVHAEAAVIAKCARHGHMIRGASLYVSLAPCLDCARLICMAGIAEVVIRPPGEAWTATVGAYLPQSGVTVREVAS